VAGRRWYGNPRLRCAAWPACAHVGERKCTGAERSAAPQIINTTQALCVPEELELLICGSPDLDFDGLHKAATYDDGYHPDHKVIAWFWEIVRAMSNDNKKKLLNFVTGMHAAHWRVFFYNVQLTTFCFAVHYASCNMVYNDCISMRCC
jgi:hypothetical protein